MGAATPFGGGSPTLEEVLRRFRELGCRVADLSDNLLAGPSGPVKIRYIENPRNGAFVFIQDTIPEDQPVGWSLLRNWERRLKVDTGF